MNPVWLALLSVAAALISIASVYIDKKRKKNEMSKRRYRAYQLILGAFLVFIVFAMVFWFIIPLANYQSS